MKHSARILFAVGLHILLCAVPASANMGFVMPPISIGVMVSVVLLTIVLSIVSGEATHKIKQIRDKGDGDIWFRVLGIPGMVTLGLYLLLKFLHVYTALWPVSILFAALVILQLSRLHASTEQDKSPGSGWINWSIFSLPVLAAVTLISPILFWFLGGMGNLILQVGLTVIWTCYGCYYGFNLYGKGTSARSGSYSFWAMRIAGVILIPATIVLALGFSNAAYRVYKYPFSDRAQWGTAKANVDVLRSFLASYAADSDTNQYPVGEFNYDQIKALLPQANLPDKEEEAKWEPYSFSYSSEKGTTFSIKVTAMSREQGSIYGSPSGVTPGSYPH
jgi:hypothetical protein